MGHVDRRDAAAVEEHLPQAVVLVDLAAQGVANAIFHATGARVTELPMTPDVVLRALQDKKGNAA